MKTLAVTLVLFGALVLAYSALKIAQGLGEAPEPRERVFAAGQEASAVFVPAETGAYEEPCAVVCRNGRTGEVRFSALR